MNQFMAGKGRVLRLWKLAGKLYGEEFKLQKLNPKLVAKEAMPNFTGDAFKEGAILRQSHSTRSAWLFRPWNDGKLWYPGVEYKGVGDCGAPIRDFAGVPWGGLYLEEAVHEHEFAKLAWASGALCQRPVAAYSTGEFKGKKLGVLARTFATPLRISDFVFQKKLFKEYLALRGETRDEYAVSLGKSLGDSVRRLFNAGIYHGSMELNNLTSEGEIADFEPTFGGTWEGLMKTSAPNYRNLALERILVEVGEFMGGARERFFRAFARSFIGKEVKKVTVRWLIEEHEGRKFQDSELEVRIDDGGNIQAAIDELKKIRKESKDKELLRRVNYVLKRFGE